MRRALTVFGPSAVLLLPAAENLFVSRSLNFAAPRASPSPTQNPSEEGHVDGRGFDPAEARVHGNLLASPLLSQSPADDAL